MVTLAALVLGSTLATASAGDAPAADAPAADDAPAAEQPLLSPREQKIERRRRRMAKIHTVAGVAMEIGAGALHAATAAMFIGHAASCDPSDAECNKGTPVVLFVPVGAIALGWIGATRLAAGREASIWRSPLFWVGTAVPLVTVLAVSALSGADNSRNERVAWTSTLVAGLVFGNVLEVWGAFTAPPREIAPTTRSISLAPGCAPTAGGVMCGLALAHF